MTRALFIIDVQNDFTEGGALGVEGGAAVAEGITEFLGRHRDAYDLVVASRDWHSGEHDNQGHFAVGDMDPDFVNSWPPHCVEGTEGAEYHEGLEQAHIDVHVKKGQGVPAYSIFEGTDDSGATIAEVLTSNGITDVDVVGLATDYCVRASALDALEHGQHVRILTDLVAGVAAETSESALAELGHAGAEIVTSSALDEADA